MTTKSVYGQLMDLNLEPEKAAAEATPPVNKATTPLSPTNAQTKKEMPSAEPKSHVRNNHDSKPDSMIASKPDSRLSRTQDSQIAEVRKAVRAFGKDPFFGRFTPEEKRQLAEIAFAYTQRGIRTSENQIARIAINYMLQDYRDKKEESFLDKILKALNE